MSNFTFLISHYSCFACVQIRHNPLSGGYCGGVPPLPIPNREVKPTCADGTAMQCGRVGRRLLSMKSLRFRKISEAFLFFFPRIFFFSAGGILHRISRMNRMAILLIGLLTDFRGYLAAGQWLAPEMGSYCFCHADFADDADFFSLIILVPQISQIYTDFFHWLFKFHRFTDSHRFFSFIIFLMDLHGFSLVLFFPCHFFFFSVISLFRRF